jgi:hypothetical protein
VSGKYRHIAAAVALWSAWVADSILFAAFGLDSLIELASAGVLMWRLSIELRRGEAFSERTERLASQIAGSLLFVLAAYVVIAAGWSLWTGGEERTHTRSRCPCARPGFVRGASGDRWAGACSP